MTTTLMGELEAMRSRCDRLSASREERADEADKAIARLREVCLVLSRMFKTPVYFHGDSKGLQEVMDGAACSVLLP